MKLIDISTPKHPNTFTMVDDADFDHLNQWKWRMDNGSYVRRNQWMDGKIHTVFMHLEILQPALGMMGDHRFGNRLDHRRENLRICTPAENNRNRKPYVGRSLPKGIHWRPDKRKFRTQITVNYRVISLGHFRTESEATQAYNAAAIKYHGEFARPNFPQDHIEVSRLPAGSGMNEG